MHSATYSYRAMPLVGVAAAMAFSLSCPTSIIEGTGSMLDISRIDEWRNMLETRTSLQVDMVVAHDSLDVRPDLRSASEHLANIRHVLNPAIADLASVFGVSRQAVYKWIGEEANPEDDKLERIRALSQTADAFRDAGIARTSSMLKMKAFDGRSLMDLIAADQLTSSHIEVLIAEARMMDAAYGRSGLAKSKAKPSDDWRAELSVPWLPE